MNRLLFTSLITLTLSAGIWAQTSVIRKPKRPTQEVIQIPKDDNDAIPVVKDVVISINYDKDQTASVEVSSSDKSGKLTNSLLGSFLQNLSEPPTEQTTTQKRFQLNPVYVFKPELSQTLADIFGAINSVRNSTANNITINLKDELELFVRRKAKATKSFKPNPLFLLIVVDAGNKIRLNGEDEGNISDLNKLKDHLSVIFRARIDNGVFRIGSNTVDTTVNLLVPNSTKFGDIQKLGLAISSVGADRIFLMFDRQDSVTRELIMNIEATPVIR